MIYFIIFILMIFLHIIEDFHIQGNYIANAKQKSWWKEQCDKNCVDFRNYKNDYKVVLLVHSLENAFFVLLPIILYFIFSREIPTIVALIHIICDFFSITYSHYKIDDMKANKFEINLIRDQLYHLGVIVMVFFTFLLCALSCR